MSDYQNNPEQLHDSSENLKSRVGVVDDAASLLAAVVAPIEQLFITSKKKEVAPAVTPATPDFFVGTPVLETTDPALASARVDLLAHTAAEARVLQEAAKIVDEVAERSGLEEEFKELDEAALLREVEKAHLNALQDSAGAAS